MQTAHLTDDQIRTLIALKADFLYYAPAVLKIKTKEGAIAPLRLNRAQRIVHRKLEAQKRQFGWVRALVVKGRQQGVSTYVEARYFHQVHLTYGRSAVVMAHMGSSSESIFGMVRRFHDNMPNGMQPRISADSTTALHYGDIGCDYSVATAGSTNIGRGLTMQLFHASEFAYWQNAADHFAGIGQALPLAAGTEAVLESTGNGPGNQFADMWKDAERGRGDYIPIFVPWFIQDEYRREPGPDFEMSPEDVEYAIAYKLEAEQMAWRRHKIEQDFRGDVGLFDQEYPAEPALAFRRVAGDPFIAFALITRARRGHPNVTAVGPKMMGLDPAEYGDDDSVLMSRQGRTAGDVYKRWHGLGPMELAGRVAIEADRYGPDMISVDATGIGSGVADRLLELGYPVNRVLPGEAPFENDRFVIRSDEMWSDMQDWLRDGPVKIPDCDILAGELGNRQYTYDSSRRLKLESKEVMRRRGLASPDGADALSLTHATRMSVSAQAIRTQLQGHKPNWWG